MRVFTVFAVVLAAVTAPSALAQPSINVGNHDLLPGTAGQTVEIFVTGGDAIEGLNLNVQIGDGLVNAGPTIQAVDIITSTIFADNNEFGQLDGLADPQIFATSVLTHFGTSVNADGLLATITLDTTGVSAGTYDLNLTGTLNGDTNLIGFGTGGSPTPSTITSGQITVVPEPTSALLLTAGGLMLTARRRRPR